MSRGLARFPPIAHGYPLPAPAVLTAECTCPRAGSGWRKPLFASSSDEQRKRWLSAALVGHGIVLANTVAEMGAIAPDPRAGQIFRKTLASSPNATHTALRCVTRPKGFYLGL